MGVILRSDVNMQLIQFEIEHFDMMKLDDNGYVSRESRAMFEAYPKIGPAITLLNDSLEVVACAGVIVPYQGMGEFWMIPGSLVPKYGLTVSKEAKRFIADTVERFSLHRIQATVREVDQRAVRWIERLGFEREGLMKRYGSDGRNYFMYARVSDV